MKKETILIGSNPCQKCGGEYGEHNDACSNSSVKRTPEEWMKIKNILVLDPDGWRGSFEKNFNTPITEEEWTWRQIRSTCMIKKNKKVVDKKVKK